MDKSSTTVNRVVRWMEIAAAFVLAGITSLTFISVVLRYLFNWSIPDSFDLSRNLLGMVIFWGIALAAFRGEHITVDLLWGALGTRARKVVDLSAGLLTLTCLSVFSWTMADKVWSTWQDKVSTFDVHIPLWIFYAGAWLGLVLCVPLMLLRIWQLQTQQVISETDMQRK